MRGSVVALGVAASAGATIEARETLRVEIARGVVGDRYAREAGTFRAFPDTEVTLVAEEDAASVGVPALSLRRNVVTRGVDLAALVGRAFRVGDVVLHGMRQCKPCGHLEGQLSRPGLVGALHGGLRARVVRAGTMRVGDEVEPMLVALDDDMRAVIEAAHLAFVATVTPEGLPNLSPKGTVRALDASRLFFLEIASPQTRRNLEKNPWMEVNVVDHLSRRGYRFLGRAHLHVGDETHRLAAERVFREDGATYADRGAVVLTVERALPLVSPGYANVLDEAAMREAWKEKRARLDAAFESHVEAAGPFAWER